MGVYRRAEEFRSVKFFVYTVGKADRPEGGVRLGSRHTGTLLPSQKAAQPSTAYQDKLGWTLSTEVRARRRGYSTQHSERGERRDLGDGLDLELNK